MLLQGSPAIVAMIQQWVTAVAGQGLITISLISPCDVDLWRLCCAVLVVCCVGVAYELESQELASTATTCTLTRAGVVWHACPYSVGKGADPQIGRHKSHNHPRHTLGAGQVPGHEGDEAYHCQLRREPLRLLAILAHTLQGQVGPMGVRPVKKDGLPAAAGPVMGGGVTMGWHSCCNERTTIFHAFV